MNLIQTLEQEEMARLGKKIPEFAPGDTVIVSASPEELGKHGLSKNDKKHFTEMLTRFFSAVACEEITAKDLASSTRRP